ncbi:MAG: Rap1a/Tai family immunity protein [Xanthomonadales bacterium]|nr:Rap1a/Tai family immunity protein [Xanthomonadales bacterium]
MSKTNTRRLLAGLPAAALLLFFTGSASAITPMKTVDLIEHCRSYLEQPDSADTLICTRYIQGFVAGAIATDDRVSRNVAKEITESANFAERYSAVRFGRKLDRFGPTYFAEFCVPEEVPLLAVVEKVVFDLKSPDFFSDAPLARDAVYKALRKDYACE